MGKLVSFDISSDFGFFKKPDINKFSLTYNLPPKPVILGIIGSVLGMSGLSKQYEEISQLKELLCIKDALAQDYDKTKRIVKKIDFDLMYNVLESLQFEKSNRLLELLKILKNTNEKDFSFIKELNMILEKLKSEFQYPEYYRKLKHLKIGIRPLVEKSDFPFNKIMNKYNSRNSYFGDDKYENIPISEQLLIKPKFRIYVYEDDDKILDELAQRIQNNNPIFMPYLGKNEFIVNFDNLEIIEDIKPITNNSVPVSSVFIRNDENRSGIKEKKMHGFREPPPITIAGLSPGFKFLEHYPIGYIEGLSYETQIAEFTTRINEISAMDLQRGNIFKVNDETVYLF